MTPSQQQLTLIKYLDTLPENSNRYQMAVNQIRNLESLKYKVDTKKSRHPDNWKKYRFRNVHFKSLRDASDKMIIPINKLEHDIKTGSKVYEIFKV